MGITTDSDLLQLANCTDTEIIAIFTDVDPQYEMRIRNGQLGYKTTALSSQCSYQYCTSYFGFNNNVCRQVHKQQMCCLPSVQDVYAAVIHLAQNISSQSESAAG